MNQTILLTSFNVWRSHQPSNSSDDLLELVAGIAPSGICPQSLTFLRKLPVDFQLAPELAIATVTQMQPDIIICCGMAESRSRLSIESRARNGERTLYTPVDLDRLVSRLCDTDISHDAGNFVCEALYYALLRHLSRQGFLTKCIFVHVPRLTPENTNCIMADFLTIIQTLSRWGIRSTRRAIVSRELSSLPLGFR
ncbi:pyroglutamyl-peptidase I family protein [Phormidium sp. CCY1219]|uniref:pyroglutamyl-peptidase I family protein n=1 Tax=Phormidium sp. CCY1219 TaxID=2886104 RepID=UPI002D1E7FBE|nr:peptidase C15 [Phormidium sp. CCY1219]MEB3829287.1 peptidase C15 [Phormidium sp. CCY1219]